MTIWHFLTRTRLKEKLDYAHLNNGQLMLQPPQLSKDISKGELTSYIYCLPSILSGMNFGSDVDEVCLLKIKLKDSARLYTYRGNPKLLKYKELVKNYDYIDMTVDSSDFSNIRFRQILLLNSSTVESWHHSLQTDFKVDFETEFEKIGTHRFQSDDFFMIDFNHEEIQAAVTLNAHLLGFQNLSQSALEINRKKVESAIVRLGAV